jgi:hypothetical protein
MDLSEAREIYEVIGKSKLSSLRRQFLEAAVRYAEQRAAWALAESGDRPQMSASRTAAHDTFIDACNILSRNMAEVGEDNSWRRRIGSDRKDIGDLACLIHCLIGLSAR